jgi:MoxR-like ATPase
MISEDTIKRIESEINFASTTHLYNQLCKQEHFGLQLQDGLNTKGEGKTRQICQELLKDLEGEFESFIKGQPEMVHIPLLSLVLGEHTLLEGLPGVGKTVMIKWIAQVTGLPFRRVQFIPDMLPSDLIGKDRIDPAALQSGSKDAVTWVNGPLFTSILLADEINRAPSKVQAALLEAMGENQITPFGKISRDVLSPIHQAALNVWDRLAPDGKDNGRKKGLLGLPVINRKDLSQFTAFATMNPIEQEGTYPLSEAQIDRFCFKVVVPYPRRQVYPDITDVVYSGKEPPKALDCQYSQADYEEYFDKNPEAMRPILGPVYFFLLCRGFVLPVKFEKQQPNIVKSMFETNAGNKNFDKIYDIVLMTNAKTSSTAGVAKRRPIYAEKEQVDLRAYINALPLEQKEQKNKLLSILECNHCQYVLAGASPRGFFKLLAAALCEAFVRGQDFMEDEHIRAVVHAVLRHRVHMDVHARLENIESVDVVDAVCDKLLDTN